MGTSISRIMIIINSLTKHPKSLPENAEKKFLVKTKIQDILELLEGLCRWIGFLKYCQII